MQNNKRVLIVEDDISIRNALRDALSRKGYTVLLAQNGKEGLEAALSEIPHLILLDIVMPIMDGITMLEKLRDDEQGRHFIVIMLSNLGDSQMVADAIALGTHDYLVKSDWKMSEIVELVGNKLNDKY